MSITVVYASPPLTGGASQLFAKCSHLWPWSFLSSFLARSHIPQPDRPVVRPTDKQGGIRRIETDAIYVIAAIFSNVSFTGTTLRLSPGERGRPQKKSLANLWPSSVFRRSPFFGSHRMILSSRPPLARSSPSKRHATRNCCHFLKCQGTHMSRLWSSTPPPP